VGPEIAYTELVTAGGPVRRRIDSPIGAVIIALDPSAPSTIRYLTESGEVVHLHEFDAGFPARQLSR
jgi:hypothetical protein